ncbi:T9SS type A sorting domain-containing protein [Winogradskyella sp. F6397]|uniref:T9SS type A sorting domain-containing protein n=1 Tax=Winogradskyella marina TaxID=2785530 RepID=A0ABS0EJ66_9FLAO|nr:T9SS type A sorting domain-containing protein [Winogradskyella marina]
MSVYNVLGKLVLVRNFADGELLNVTVLASGIYTIKINNKMTLKFIKA